VDDELLTVSELALVLKVEVRFVRRLVAERRIPFVKVGKYVRFCRQDVTDFITSGRVEPITVAWSGGRAVA
jgi:excisionase family DNA binding protein